jgi:hypothetical protein
MNSNSTSDHDHDFLAIFPSRILWLLLTLAIAGSPALAEPNDPSIARIWIEETLTAISNDFARPTVHARNLYHTSAAIWDGWAAYDRRSDAVFHSEFMTAQDVDSARLQTISHAAFRLLTHRFMNSPGNDPNDPDNPDNTLNRFRQRMVTLGLDPDFNQSVLDTPASLGIRIANTIILHGLADSSNEQNGYGNLYYLPVNPPLDLDQGGNPDMIDPNRWQPLTRADGFVDQSGNEVGQARSFLGAEWGLVTPFSLIEAVLDIHTTDSDYSHWVYLNPGPPPFLGESSADTLAYINTFVRNIEYSAMLTPDDGEFLDISPASLGNNSLGANDGSGYDSNPHTGQPYQPQIVPRGDYYRVIAEYWADGPASETPPGHWFSLLNQVNDSPELERRLGGQGPLLDALEWDVKAYLALGGAVHDAAISAWSVKGYYDYPRPVATIRYMAGRGQSSEPSAPHYDPHGLPLLPGLIEMVTEQSSEPGQPHAHLNEYVGEIAVFAWQGHVDDATTQYAGVGWMLASNWNPYQQANFVTPPFAGYVSGHSTFSRAAAEVLTLLTGSAYFPGGLHEYCVEENDYLVFEIGPSQDLCLQWARYYDAADQSGLSRIYGGIHPPADDIPGRLMGYQVGQLAFQHAMAYFQGHVRPIFKDGFQVSENP